MTQLVKHYWINRDTGGWATDTRFGLMIPNIRGLEIKYELLDLNDIPFFLSYVPEYFEYEITVSSNELENYQNNSNIIIVSSIERQIEEEIRIPGSIAGTIESTGETHIITVYDIIYREPYILEESEGLSILTQEEWDNEISSFDNRQEKRRYNILRINRDKMLELTDWVVTKDLEQGKTLDEDFKTWRQLLRTLPNTDTFPISYPTLPISLQNNEELVKLTNSFEQIRNINMINDPLSLV